MCSSPLWKNFSAASRPSLITRTRFSILNFHKCLRCHQLDAKRQAGNLDKVLITRNQYLGLRRVTAVQNHVIFGIPAKRELSYGINYLCVGYNGSDAGDKRLSLLVGDLTMFFEFDRSIPILLKKFRGDIDICFFECLYYGFSWNAAEDKGRNYNTCINYNSISSSRKLFSLQTSPHSQCPS